MKTVSTEVQNEVNIADNDIVFEYGEYNVTCSFSENGVTLTEALVDYVEKMVSLKFAL
jgi:Fe-S cluster assembly iron-binding protein IscA